MSRHGLAPGGRDLERCRDLDTVQVTVWALFMNTVHRVKKKKKYKNFKNFLVGDFIYEIFILHLL